MEQMEQALEHDQVVEAVIHQNSEVPTGYVSLNMLDEGQKRVYVTDVKEPEQQILKEAGVPVTVADVPKQNTILTTLLPVLYRRTDNLLLL